MRLLSLTIWLLLCSCANLNYSVTVDSQARAEVSQGTTYFLAPIGADGLTGPLHESDFNWDRFSESIEAALADNGMARVNSPYEADQLVLVDYGVGQGVPYTYTYSVPVYGQTGYASSTTSGSFTGSTFSSFTTYQPSYGIVGSTAHTGSGMYFPRHLILTALQLPLASGEAPESEQTVIWRTCVGSAGSSNDIRQIFPVLAAVGWRHFGSDSGGSVDYELRARSARTQDGSQRLTWKSSLMRDYEEMLATYKRSKGD
jgi:hypothetical protein